MCNPTNCAFNADPAAAAKNQRDIICELKARGANLVVTERPTGEINISPKIINAHDPKSHNGDTRVAVPHRLPGIARSKNDAPAKINPTANFIGDEGAFLRQRVHIVAKKGVYNIIKNGFNDWNQAAGNHEWIVRVSAKVANTTDPCSSNAQNNTAPKKSGIYAKTRERSLLVTFLEDSI